MCNDLNCNYDVAVAKALLNGGLDATEAVARSLGLKPHAEQLAQQEASSSGLREVCNLRIKEGCPWLGVSIQLLPGHA